MDGPDGAASGIAVITLTGAGRGLCAGADLSATGEGWSPQAKTQLGPSMTPRFGSPIS